MAWSQSFFSKTATSKKFAPKWEETPANSSQITSAYNFGYFNPASKLKGKREMLSNRNLLNEGNFAKFHQSGKKSANKLYKGLDIDGDEVHDLVAVDPSGFVVGFNENYLIPEGKGETAYRRDYYDLSNEQREALTYQQFLDMQANIDGWKDLSKRKESRKEAPFQIIKKYLDEELKALKASNKDVENICKKLLSLVSEAFFAPNVPLYLRKVITGTSEFKTNVLKKYLHSDTIKIYLPESIKKDIVERMDSYIQGYTDGGIHAYLRNYWAQTYNNSNLQDNVIKNFAINLEDATEIYNQILSKQALNKVFRDNGINALTLAQHPEIANQLKAAYENEKKKLDEKNQMTALGEQQKK